MEFNDRAKKILKAIITSYIETAEPVGSRTITKKYGFGLSPATIRNIMADLEELGYLAQPYTSAGRVPTEKGYRYYVDYLFEERHFEEGFLDIKPEQIDKRYLPVSEDVTELLKETSQLLSFLSKYTGIVIAPRFKNTILRHVEFIKLKPGHILVIFVAEKGNLHSKVVEIEEDLSQRDFDRMTAYLNEELAGLTLHEVRERVLSQMNYEKDLYSRLLKRVIRINKEFFTDDAVEVYLGGTTNILELPEFANLERMKVLFKAFEEKYLIVKLLDKCLRKEGVQVFIGLENLPEEMRYCSVVMSNYKSGDRIIGTLGVIGPMRMEYARVIPLVEYTARRLEKQLSEL